MLITVLPFLVLLTGKDGFSKPNPHVAQIAYEWLATNKWDPSTKIFYREGHTEGICENF